MMDNVTHIENEEKQITLGSEGFAREIAEAIAQGIVVTGEKCQFEYVNPAYAHMVGRSATDLVGLSFFDVIHPDDEAKQQWAYQQYATGHKLTYDIRFLRPDGSIVYGQITDIPRLEGDKVVGSFAIVTDLTEQKQAKIALRQSEERYRTVVEDMPGLLCRFLSDGTLEFVNEAYAHIFGRPPQELIGQNFLSFVPEENRTAVMATLMDLTPESPVITHEHPVIVADGEMRWQRWTNRLLTDEAGQPVGYQSFGLDITEQKHIEQQLQDSEKLLHTIAENFPRSYLSIIHPDLTVGFTSGQEFKRHQLDSDAHIGLHVRDVFSTLDEEDLAKITTAYRQTFAGQAQFFELRIGDEYQSYETVPLLNEQGDISQILAVVRNITERKQMDETLRESEEKIHLLLEHTPTALAMFDREMRYLAYSERWRLHYSLNDDLLGQTHYEIIPDIPEKWREVHRRALAGEILQAEEDEFVRRDGTVYWIRWDVHPWYTADDEIGGIIIFAEDVTERRAARMALQQSEIRYQAIVEDQTELIVRAKPDGTILFANEAYSRTFGSTPAEIIGQNVFLFMHDKERNLLQEKFRRLTLSKPVEINEQQEWLPDGRSIWLRWTDRGIFDENGRLVEVQGVGFDISESRTTEERLRQSEAQLQHIIDTVPEGVMLLTADGSVHLTNPVANQYLQILAPGWENGRLTHLGERPLADLLTTAPQELWHKFSFNNLDFEAIGRPIQNSADNMGWVLVLRDVTREQDIQRRIQQQERLAAVGQLAAGIAHDFNNILAAITLYAELIMQIIALPPHIQDKLQTIAQQAHRGADLIQQILDFSRQSIMERKPVNLLPFMEKLVKLLKRTLPENVHITLDCSEEKYILLADASRLQQVIMNLAVNARDAMPQGGQIVIRLTRVQTMRAKPILVRELPPGSWIQIQVSDSGGGIPPHVLPQIFEPFFTTKEVGKGTGLGLAQAYGIMQQHEGHIDVITAMGQGTTFMLYLPSPDGTNRDVQAPRRAKLQEGKGQTVLIVEDNPTTLGALVDSLLLLNYKVIEVGNGREALNVLTDPARPIDLVLSDVVMPEMGGIALLQAMQAQQMTVPIVLLTGHPLSSEMEDLESMGLAGWLLKPPTLAKLSQLLAQVLD